MAWKVGRPSFLRTWETKWVGGSIPCKREVEDDDVDNDKPGDYVSDLMTAEYEWNYEIINSLMEDEWRNRVIAIPIPLNGTTDSFYWNGTTSGEYSVKSGYNIALNDLFELKATDRDKDKRVRFIEEVKRCSLWNLPGPSKWKVFVWKIMTDTLPLGEEFRRRGLGAEEHCHVCGNEDMLETQEHLFRDCPVTTRFWAGTDLGIRSGVGRECSLKIWVINWLALLAKKDDTKESTISFVAALWTLWCNRNDMIFRKCELTYEKLLNLYKDAVRTATEGFKRIKTATRREKDDERERIRNHYPFSIVGRTDTCHATRIKVDAAWDNDGRAAYGWVSLDELGAVKFNGSRKCRAQSPLQAESMAIRNVMIWAKHQGILHLWILSDCLQAILHIANLTKEDHLTMGIITEINNLASNFHCCIFSFIPRGLNRMTHNLAKKAKLL